MIFLLLIPALAFQIFLWWLVFQSFPSSDSGTGIDAVSVVICFRDEKSALPELLRCINQQTGLEKKQVEFILVDDHSTDGSSELIASERFHVKVLLNKGQGKKSALETGIAEAKHPYTLMMDADVSFGPHHLQNLLRTIDPRASMAVLPIVYALKKGPVEGFQFLDFGLMQWTNFAFAMRNNALFNNGAHLLVKTQHWLEQRSGLKKELASGDDVFMLHRFKEIQLPIQTITNPDLAIVIQPEDSFMDLLNQRARWGVKAKNYTDWSSAAVAHLVFWSHLALTLAFIIPVFQNYQLALWETMLYFSYVLGLAFLIPKIERLQGQKGLPRFWMFLFPAFYSLFILLSVIKMRKVNWKGRRI